jgi:hypothetical protein
MKFKKIEHAGQIRLINTDLIQEVIYYDKKGWDKYTVTVCFGVSANPEFHFDTFEEAEAFANLLTDDSL